MAFRTSLLIALGIVFAAAGAEAQIAPGKAGAEQRKAAGPDQPIQPQAPTLQRRGDPQPAAGPQGQPAAAVASPAQQPPPAAVPFQSTPQQEAEADRALKLWEQNSSSVKTFECKFKRWVYDPVFVPGDKAAFEDLGVVKFASPDKGLYQIDGARAEQWICDGKSIFEFNYSKKQLIERRLPPEYQGKAIANGPLPFLFGTKADQLKQRYFVHVITPREKLDKETWLEVFPRFQQDAANYQRAELILINKNMTISALSLYEPNGKNHTTYAFYEVVINDPLIILKSDPFAAKAPSGWQKVVEDVPTTTANQKPASNARK
jgi:TIGR03009 family protein